MTLFDHTRPVNATPDPEWVRRDVAPLQADETVEVPFTDGPRLAYLHSRRTFAERARDFLPITLREAPWVILRDHARDAFMLRSHQRAEMVRALDQVVMAEERRLFDTTANLDGCRIVIDLKGDTVYVTLTNHTPDAVRYVAPEGED